MSITSDYHVHSNHSGDSEAKMEDMVLRAIDLGLTDICFTEHQDIDFYYEKPEEAGMFDLNTDSYLYELLALRNKYADRINILFGVEIGVQKQLRRELAIYAKSHEFDFIIASTHIVNGRDPYYPSFYEGRTDEEAYREYFEATLDNLKTFSNFDIYGHLDYVVRYGKNKDADYTYEKYKDVIDPILEKLIEMEKGIEINTSGLSHGLKEFNPSSGIIKRYRELGGEIITVGSDAHEPESIARDFDKAYEVLKECGFKYYCTFEKRVAEFHKIV